MNADVAVVAVAPNMDDDVAVAGKCLDLDSLMIKLAVVHSINHKVIYPN